MCPWVFAGLMLFLASMVGAADVTVADAQSDFAAGQYPACLKKISQAMNGPTAKPGSQGRYDLFMLRGECMLQLKQPSAAIEAFRAASRVVKNDTDVHRASAASATAILIAASKNLAYTPQSQGAQPIDIVSPGSRKQALSALWDDRLAAAKPKIDEALQATQLTPIQELMPTLRDLILIEDAATGTSEKTLPLITSLGEHARELITTEVARLARRIDNLQEMASEPVSIEGRRNDTIVSRGLVGNEHQELQDMGEYLTQIIKVAQEGRRINRRLGGSGEVWDQIIADCEENRDEAQQLLDRR